MIFVKRDPALIPDKVFEVARKAQEKLEALPEEERLEFIKKKSHVWRGFKKYLKKMSYGKCWYSETVLPGGIYDVDHFRPKAKAIRAEDRIDDDGYAWLSFDWENFRLSAQKCNQLTKDEETDETVGKGCWFPLKEGSPVATWDNRCLDDEEPELIDPTKKSDVELIDFDSDGYVKPASYCVGIQVKRVNTSAERYGLNLPEMREARLKVMREVNDSIDAIMTTVSDLSPLGEQAGTGSIDKQKNILKKKTRANAPFCAAARTQLLSLGNYDVFIDRSLDYQE